MTRCDEISSVCVTSEKRLDSHGEMEKEDQPIHRKYTAQVTLLRIDSGSTIREENVVRDRPTIGHESNCRSAGEVGHSTTANTLPRVDYSTPPDDLLIANS